MPAHKPAIDVQTALSHRRRNLLQSLLLIGGMALLLAACGWIVAGGTGVVVAAVVGSITLAVSGRISPELMLRLFRARQITARELPEILHAVQVLAARAGLEVTPRIYYISSPNLNAFSVGRGRNAAIAVTTGLLQAMGFRELIGILAHETSHIRNNDIWVMGLADMMTRLTRSMSLLGMFLLLLNLPFALMGTTQIPWILVLLLVFAPTLGSLLQMALSRTREFEADLSAAHLTGDPVGLAHALEKLERIQGGFWEDILLGSRRIPDPSLLRTHPRTEERVERLLELRLEPEEALFGGAEVPIWPRANLPKSPPRPRHRVSGLWY